MPNITRYRIRPPGCKDESKYQWRTISGTGIKTNGVSNGVDKSLSNGHAEKKASMKEEPKQTEKVEEAPTSSPTSSLKWENSIQEAKKSLIEKMTKKDHQQKVEGKLYKGSHGSLSSTGVPCHVTRKWKDKRSVDEILSLTNFDGDTPDAIFTREHQFPFYSFPVKYTLQMRKGEGIIEYFTPHHDTKDMTNVYLHLIVEIVSNGNGEVTADFIMTQTLPLNIGGPEEWRTKKAFESTACLLHRLSKGIKLSDPGLGKNVEGFVQKFSKSCSSSEFVQWKNYEVEGIGEVPIFRRPETDGTNYAAFRAEAELDGTPADFAALMESMGMGGYVRETMTPECESQEYMEEDGPLKVVRKTDKIAPWPLSKREFLFTSLSCWDTDGTLFICQKSIDIPKVTVKSGSCRALFHEVGFRCVPTGPNKMKVMQLVHADPISLPKSAVEAKMTDRAKVLGKIKTLFTQRDKWL